MLSPVPEVLGQLLCLVLANELSMFVPLLYILPLNVVHRACPIVCPPERATKSVLESPRALNLELSWFKVEVGPGISLLAWDWLAVVASLLPNFTFQLGPPRRTTESRAAIARISAQETIPGQAFSTAVLMLSMTSKPLAEFLLGFAFFSPVKLDVSSNKMDPSHPLTKQS